MKEFLLTIFLCTSIVYFVFAFISGKMLYQPMAGYGSIYQVNGIAARIFSAFCAVILIICAYDWIPLNNVIFSSPIYSNIVSILVGICFGLIIFLRTLKFNVGDFNIKNGLFFREHYIIYIIGIFIFYLILVLWKLFQDGYFKK
jgi:hypothetical protein